MVCLTRNQKTRPINNSLNTQYYYTVHTPLKHRNPPTMALIKSNQDHDPHNPDRPFTGPSFSNPRQKPHVITFRSSYSNISYNSNYNMGREASNKEMHVQAVMLA